MCKLNKKSGNKRIDPCMKNIVSFINNATDFTTLGSCCGHGKYHSSLIVKHPSYSDDVRLEIFSHKIIRRKKRFYIKDKQGYYYIPEIKKEER
jgi:hypothetical protein